MGHFLILIISFKPVRDRLIDKLKLALGNYMTAERGKGYFLME